MCAILSTGVFAEDGTSQCKKDFVREHQDVLRTACMLNTDKMNQYELKTKAIQTIYNECRNNAPLDDEVRETIRMFSKDKGALEATCQMNGNI